MISSKSRYKHIDVEEFVDIYFYRPFGYRLAIIAKFLSLSPNVVTVISMIIGMLGGHFFYYSSLNLNIIGIALFVFSNALDSADGILARMTNTQSKIGRILDGVAGNAIFFSIYLHLCLRYISGGGLELIFLVALAASVSHSFQSGIADYYREGFLYFVKNPKTGGFDDSIFLSNEYNELRWKTNFIEKLLLRLYSDYTRRQELLAQKCKKLIKKTEEAFGTKIPQWLSSEYRNKNKPMVKYYNLLTTNARMFVLFILLFYKIPEYYFIFELTVLNGFLVFVIFKQNKISDFLIQEIKLRYSP